MLLPAHRLLVEDPEKASAGKKAFIVNRIGDFGVLLAMFLIFWTLQRAGLPSLRFEDIRTHLDAFAPNVATAVCLLLFRELPASRHRFRCTCGSPMRWPDPPRCRRSSTPPPW